MKRKINKLRLGLLIGLCALLTGAAAAHASGRPGWTALRERLGLSKPATPPAPFVPTSAPTPPIPTKQEVGDTLLNIHLTPFGFQPDQIRTRSGPTRIYFRNLSGADKLNLNFSGQNGAVQQTVSAHAAKGRTFRVNLPAGVYVLSDPDRPDITCRITVE